MKTLSLAILAASSLAIATTSVSARAGEVVNFSYLAEELATEQSRAMMLKRMKAATVSACAGRKAEAYQNSAECEQDLQKQFIVAIGDPKLIAQADAKPIQIARTTG